MLAYLVESTETTASGQIKGKSLRCYEVEYTDPKNILNFTPTGNMFSIKDGQIVKSRTKATLGNKYVSWRNQKTTHSKINDSVAYYGCSLFDSPILALAAKHQALTFRTNQMIDTHQKAIENATRTLSSIPSASFIAEEYPEIYI